MMHSVSRAPTTGQMATRQSDMTKLCRICSSEGLYNLHARIPFFLHAGQNEIDQWPQTIAEMLADVTGVEYGTISKDDELPQRACSICISYLKHAVTFRQEALSTIRNLRMAKAIKDMSGKDDYDLNDGFDTDTDVAIPAASANANSGKFFKSNMIHKPYENAPTMFDVENLQHELDLFFADEDEDADESEDESLNGQDAGHHTLNNGRSAASRGDTVKEAIHNFFNYSEKPFAEDDLTNFPGITVKEPEDDNKERKCYACKRRFMLNDSFDAHMKDCVQAMLFSFVSSSQKLVELKKNKLISAQEFTRRMIFSVKGLVKSLAMCYKVTARQKRTSVNTDVTFTAKDMPKQLFQSIDRTAVTIPSSPFATSPQLGMPSNGMHTVQPIRFPKVPNFAAKCPSCLKLFDSIHALEEHNQQNHNDSSRSATNSISDIQSTYDSDDQHSVGSNRNTLLDLLRADAALTGGIVDVGHLRRTSPQVANIRLTKNNLSAFGNQ